MKDKFKKLSTYIILIVYLLSASRVEASKITISIDGQPLDLKDQEPYISETGRTMIPVRSLAQVLGYKISWTSYNEVSKGRVDIFNEENLVSLEVGSNTASVNGIRLPIDLQEGKLANTKVELVNNTTYVPLRFIVESLNSQLEFSQENGKNLINIKKGPQAPEGDFIKPQLQVIHQTTLDDPCFFVVRLKNFKDYKGKNVKFTSYLESHSQYDLYKYRNLVRPEETVVVDLREKYRNLSIEDHARWFDIYRFEKTKNHLDIKTGKPQALPEVGEAMRLILEMEMNSVKKTYYVDFEFRGGPSYYRLD